MSPIWERKAAERTGWQNQVQDAAQRVSRLTEAQNKLIGGALYTLDPLKRVWVKA